MIYWAFICFNFSKCYFPITLHKHEVLDNIHGRWEKCAPTKWVDHCDQPIKTNNIVTNQSKPIYISLFGTRFVFCFTTWKLNFTLLKPKLHPSKLLLILLLLVCPITSSYISPCPAISFNRKLQTPSPCSQGSKSSNSQYASFQILKKKI